MLKIFYKKLGSKQTLFFGLITFIPLLTIPFFAIAQTFQPMVNIPGVTDLNLRDNDIFNKYINALYMLSISIASLLAVIKIIFGGVRYMLSDVVTDKGEAKKDIKGALLGLLIVLAAVLILNTINSSLTDYDIFKSAIDTEINYDAGIDMRCLTDPENNTELCGGSTDYYSSVEISDSTGVPTLEGYQSLPQEVTDQFFEDCHNGEGEVITTISSLACRGSNLNYSDSATSILDMIPSDTTPDRREILTNQFSNFIAPYEPDSVDIESVRDQTGADEVIFVVQSSLIGDNAGSGAESQQESFCTAVGGQMVTGGTAYRACVR